MIEEHTCFCAQVKTWARSSAFRLARSNGDDRWPRVVFPQNTLVIIRNVFFFFVFLDATASQCHAPPTLWSSDRRVVVDDTITHLSESIISGCFKNARTRHARVASARRQGRIRADDSEESSFERARIISFQLDRARSAADSHSLAKRHRRRCAAEDGAAEENVSERALTHFRRALAISG